LVEFRILGPVEVVDATGPLAVGTPQARALLAVLILHVGRVVSIDELADELWSAERGATDVRPTIHTYVSRLRRVLRDAPETTAETPKRNSGRLVTQRPGYLLRVESGELDLHRFDALVAKARTAQAAGELTESAEFFRQAHALWRGEPFADVPHTPSIAAEADRLSEYRLGTREEQFDTEIQLGRHAELVAELTTLVGRYPLRERLRFLLMLALYRSGRQADSLRLFADTRAMLVDELGVEPGPDLRELHERILRADPELAPSVLVSPLRARRPASTPVDDRLDRAAEALSTAISRQWTVEAQHRSLHRPEPVHVRWSATGRPVAPSPAGDEPGRPDLHGDLTDVVEKFRLLPVRQLVVLGEPGAGKTVLAVLLTLGLLRDLRPDEQIPVLLSLSTWDPHREHLDTWFARRLVEEYPGLANTGSYGRDTATRLVLAGRVIPVLDGLDEMPTSLRAAAIDALDRAVAGGRPLVVTCRSTEYEHAVRDGGVLAAASVVEIEPVAVEDVIAFLIARRRLDDTRWHPLVDRLRSQPHGELARALSTPLMVDLARTAYADSGTEPAELLDLEQFPDQRRLEEHLLDAFLPAVYAHRPPPPLISEIQPRPAREYRPEQAQKWLATLARQLDRQGTRDFAWWQLVWMLPWPTRGLVLAVPPALLFGVTGAIAANARVGLVYGISFGLVGFLAHTLARRPAPARVEVRFHGTARPFLVRFAIGLAIGVGLGLGWALDDGLIALLVVTFGICLGVQVWLTTPADAARVSSPSVVLRQDRTATLVFTLCFVVALGLFYGTAFAFTKQTRFLPILGGSFDLAIALAAGLSSALLGRFLFGRPGIALFGPAGTLVGGMVFERASTLAFGFAVGAIFGVAVGLMVGLSRAWGTFVFTRTWLALRGRSPSGLLRFLDDAHRRGVLRQAGAVYQFRHARLQDRLAARE
jgi:DNA-binding SARP family transcriptional activator